MAYVLSLHEEGTQIKIILLHVHKKQIEIVHRCCLDSNVKPLYILNTILSGKDVTVATALDSKEVMWRTLSVKLTKRREILATLPFQIETLFPYPLEKIILIPFFAKKGKGETDLTLCAASQETLENHLEEMSGKGIDPDCVTCTPLALLRAAEFFFPGHTSMCLFHCTENSSFYAVAIEGKLVLAQTFTRETKQIERVLSFLQMKFPSSLPSVVFLSGDKECTASIEALLKTHFTLLTPPHSEEYVLALGVALDALYGDERSVQFRQKRFTPEHRLVKRGKRFVYFAAACALLASITGIGSHFCLKHKENSILQQYQSTSSSVEELMLDWDREIGKQKKAFPLTLTVPKVSAVLSWLSTDPLLKSEEIEMKRVHYSLAQYPQLGEAVVPYLARVELEFSSSSPRSARTFHDALLRGEGMVNAQKEITWNVHENTYYTSFFLKRGVL